jgi:sortase (surface protein transpeptidase)
MVWAFLPPAVVVASSSRAREFSRVTAHSPAPMLTCCQQRFFAEAPPLPAFGPRWPSSRPSATIAPPIRLLIPKLKVDAAVESVTQDRTGAMLAPRGADNVAWYKLGARPGEVGNAVIAGHLDDMDGAPASFWDIEQLAPGDLLIVIAADGLQYHFVVVRLERYSLDGAPMQEIFGFTLRRRLNLITCDGRWDPHRQSYSKRLVVYTEFVETIYTERPFEN